MKDNYDAFRKAGHSRVSVKMLTTEFTKYVAASAKAADKNKDGFRTATDAKGLPKDLRDNFLNYLQATDPPPQPTTITDQGRKALADDVKNVLFNTGNPEGAAFRSAITDGQTPTAVAEIRRQLDEAAASWSPTATDWQKTVSGNNTAWSGRFFQLYTEVRFEGTKPPSVYLEID